MNTPLREAIQREIRRREEKRLASANETSPETPPGPALHGIQRQGASQPPFQSDSPSAPQQQGFSEKEQDAPGTVEAPPQFPGHPLSTSRSGGREIATASGANKPPRKRGAGRKLTERDKELAGFLGVRTGYMGNNKQPIHG